MGIVTAREFIVGTCKIYIETLEFVRSVHPLAERGSVASNAAKRGVWALDCIGPK
jgi:hypothetical protein